MFDFSFSLRSARYVPVSFKNTYEVLGIFRSHEMMMAIINAKPKYPIVEYTFPTNVVNPTKLAAKPINPITTIPNLKYLWSGAIKRTV